MKSSLIPILLCAVVMASPAAAAEKTELKTEKEKLSYSIGVNIGNNVKRQLSGIDVDPGVLAKAIKDVLSGTKPLMTEKEAQETIAAWQKDRAEKTKRDGEKFLAENKKKEGVKTLPSGLQYKVITEGTGKTPSATDTVTVQYKGTLIDGTEFDSSYKSGHPATFAVSGVIKGWTEALQLMKEGSKWQLVIPSDLAYGASGTQGGPIGPNAVLIFDVELVSIKAQEK